MDAFCVVDDVLMQGIQGISDLISMPRLIKLDFADVRTTMKDKGIAHMGIGVGPVSYTHLSGGLTGVGLGNSTQKYLYLTYGDSDFIFSIIGEEIGFIGIVAMLGVYALLMIRGLRCAWYAQDTYGLMMATGIISTIAIQLLINVAVCTSSMPPTGLPLPFISSGLSLIHI